MSNFWDSVISGTIAGIGNMFGGIPNAVMDYQNFEWQQDAFEKNYELQQKNYDLQVQNYENNWQNQADVLAWNKQAQDITWNREDTAIQRRAADLQAAGLSKTLAAGSAAASSPAVHLNATPMQAPTNAPQKTPAQFKWSGADPSTLITGAISMATNIARTKADIALADAQSRKIEEEKKGLEIDNLVKADRNREEIQALALRNVILGTNVDEAKLDVQLKSLGVTSAEISNYIASIDAKIKEKFGLSDADVTLLAKQQALANAQQENAIKGYNFGKSSEFGLRTSDSLSAAETALEYLKAQSAAQAANANAARKAADRRKRGASGKW